MKVIYMSKISIIYTTFENADQAGTLIRTLLERGLAGCANLVNMESQYFWNNAFCKQAEVVVILKTTLEKADALRAALEKEHPYKIPCIMSWDVEANSAYYEWISGKN